MGGRQNNGSKTPRSSPPLSLSHSQCRQAIMGTLKLLALLAFVALAASMRSSESV